MPLRFDVKPSVGFWPIFPAGAIPLVSLVGFDAVGRVVGLNAI
jgi:hypothetical protein